MDVSCILGGCKGVIICQEPAAGDAHHTTCVSLMQMNEVPDPDGLMDVLMFLQSDVIGLSGPDLSKVLTLFPEVMSCSVDERLRPNVERLQREWSMNGSVLKNAIVRKPTLLGLSVDCSTVGSGACQGQCRKCWSAN